MLKTKSQARNLDAVMDSDLNFNSHIKTITKSAYYHLKNISRIKDSEKPVHALRGRYGITSKVDHAFISSKLVHCNNVLTGVKKNTADRVLTNSKNVAGPDWGINSVVASWSRPAHHSRSEPNMEDLQAPNVSRQRLGLSTYWLPSPKSTIVLLKWWPK